MPELDRQALLQMTRDIVIAEVSNNPVSPEALPSLIEETFQSLLRILANGDAGQFAGASRTAMLAGFAGDYAAAPTDSGEGGTSRPTAALVNGAASVAGLQGFADDGDAAGEPMDGEHLGRTAREDRREPAVPRERSVHPDFIYCLFDGVRRKMLKRHIKTRYGMSPEAYRSYWELGEDYPMTAPNYSTEKRDYAVATGFGHVRQRAQRSAGRG